MMLALPIIYVIGLFISLGLFARLTKIDCEEAFVVSVGWPFLIPVALFFLFIDKFFAWCRK